MNFHLLQHRKLSEVLSIPNGLEDLMADIAREVLRYQPSNIECFIADYLESLVLTRELMYVADRTINDILSNSIQVGHLVKNANISIDEAVSVLNIAEEELRRKKSEQISELEIIQNIIEKFGLKDEQAEKIKEIILNSWCHFYTQNLARSNCMRLNPQVLDASAAKNTLLYHQRRHNCQNKLQNITQERQLANSDENWITKNFQRRENAAIVIQSWYRRKKRDLTEKEKAALTIQMALKGFKQRKQHEKIINKAATVIQKTFRDYKIRKELEI